MKKRNITKENIDRYLKTMAVRASRQLFHFCRSQIDTDDLIQEAQIAKIRAIENYKPDVEGAIPLEAYIIFIVRRHFIELARHLQVIAKHQNLEAMPESFLPVCDVEEKEYCNHLLSMVKIDKDREVLEEYLLQENEKPIAQKLGVSKQMINHRKLRAINNIHTQLEKVNV